MIESDTQLKVTQEQIQRLESALALLRRTATPAEFAAQAPAVIEHIRRMRDEIDALAELQVKREKGFEQRVT